LLLRCYTAEALKAGRLQRSSQTKLDSINT
jgi:hypothetical protein